MFSLTTDHVLKLAEINYFQPADSEMFFFGLRACLPVSGDASRFQAEHNLELTPYDHIHPRCTIGQFDHRRGIALFPGSTVPYIRYIKESVLRMGKGTNMLLTGFYRNYKKGIHRANSTTGHHAFRQDGRLPIRRTYDDTDYDYDDNVEISRPRDNLHAAWSMGPDHDYFGSAGCQVVVGYPDCEARNNTGDTGDWKIFKENAYKLEQQSFDYMLLNGRDALKVSNAGRNRLPIRLRYGSKGEIISEMQKKLKQSGFYEGAIDQDFGPLTLMALLEFQTTYFGDNADDGIVGPITATALGINAALFY